jgi:NAD(P)-dependent dehydrogenase (short-subunit alcohol dehydrogenase family)
MNSEYADSVVLITGGANGIGKATAELFLARRATVAVLDVDPTNAAEGCECHTGSVASDEDVARAVAAVAGKHGRIDVLVNNAGISFYGSVEEGSPADWLRVIDVNLLGVMRTTRAALPHLRRSSHGAIVNVASCLSCTGMTKRALYSATKGGVEALSRAMAADLVGEGIRVNCVNPGAVDTAFVAGLAQTAGQDTQAFGARQPTGQLVTPEEVAHAVAYLARPGARSTVGSVLTVEAGFGSLRT